MCAPGTESTPNEDLDILVALVACTAAHFSIDATRICVGGHSAGGTFTNKVLRARSSLVAGGIVGSVFVLVRWGGDNDR